MNNTHTTPQNTWSRDLNSQTLYVFRYIKMMKVAFVFTVFCIIISCEAKFYTALEADQSVDYWKSEGWQQLERVGENTILELSFALKQENLSELEELFWQVSDPDSPMYGKYLSTDQITEMIAPRYDTILLIEKWLKSHGATDCQLVANRDYVNCRMTRKIAEKILTGAVFFYFRHDKYHKKVIRSTSRYYIHSFIAKYLDLVGGIHRFPAVNWMKTKIDDMPSVNEAGDAEISQVHVGVYPKILRQRYNMTADDVGSHPNNSQAVAQFLEQYFSNSDLSEFMSMFVGSDFVHQSEITKIVGPNTGKSGIEATLDTQYIMGMGANITTWFWSTAGRYQNQEPFLTWLQNIASTKEVPPVHSISYGDVESSLSVPFMQRVNTEFMKAGVRGISFLFASGDNGADCKGNKFAPDFPVSSPYVTSVGGTGFSNPFTVGPEFAYEISGGGFSNIFQQPTYQAEAIDAYMQAPNVPPQEYFNKTGRAYPDIAAICRHFWIVNNRVPVPGVMGTSASTPTVAGIISMVNEHRLKAGKPVMGFLNPFIYKNPTAFYDVQTGCNEGCLAHDKGFCATEGFDPVTGYGTPNFPDLVKAAMAVFDE